MKQIKLFFFFSFSVACCFGQNSDSLLERYKSYPDDSNKVNLLYEQGFANRNTNLPAAIQFAKACYTAAVATDNKQYLAKALNLSGILKSEMGLNNEALADFKRALELRIQISDTLSQAILLNNLGNVYAALKSTKQALLCYEKSLQIAKSVHSDYWMKAALFSVAELQTNLKMYKQAEGNLYTLIGWAQTKNEYEILGMCYKNMSICKLNSGDTASAEAYLMQALDIAAMTDDDILKADALCGLGEIYLLNKKYESSLKNLQEALGISVKNKYNEGLVNTWKKLADYYKATAMFKEAYYYLAKHDSAIALVAAMSDDALTGLWKEKKASVEESKPKPFSLKNNIFECILIAALLILVIFVLAKRKHE